MFAGIAVRIWSNLFPEIATNLRLFGHATTIRRALKWRKQVWKRGREHVKRIFKTHSRIHETAGFQQKSTMIRDFPAILWMFRWRSRETPRSGATDWPHSGLANLRTPERRKFRFGTGFSTNSWKRNKEKSPKNRRFMRCFHGRMCRVSKKRWTHDFYDLLMFDERDGEVGENKNCKEYV